MLIIDYVYLKKYVFFSTVIILFLYLLKSKMIMQTEKMFYLLWSQLSQLLIVIKGWFGWLWLKRSKAEFEFLKKGGSFQSEGF